MLTIMTSAMFYKATNLIKITIEDFTTAVFGPVLLACYDKPTGSGRAAEQRCAGRVLPGLVCALASS